MKGRLLRLAGFTPLPRRYRRGLTAATAFSGGATGLHAACEVVASEDDLEVVGDKGAQIAIGVADFVLRHRMAPDGTIIEEPKVSFEKLKEYVERERLGPLFAQEPQNARQVLVCPNCATAFLVTNIPKYAEEKGEAR